MKITQFLIFFLSVLLSGPVSADDSFFTDEGFVLYDNFSDRTINPDLWIGDQKFNHSGDESGEEYIPWNSMELARVIKRDPEAGKKRGRPEDGALHLITTVEGALAEGTPGTSGSRIGYYLKERDIVGIGGRLRFHDYETYADPSGCSPGSARSRLRIFHRLFNAEYSDPEDLNGEVNTYVALERRSYFTEEGMRVIAVAFKCIDPICWDIEIKYLYNFGFVDPDEDVEVTMEFLGSHFIFRYGAETKVFTNPWTIVGPALGGGGAAIHADVNTPVCEAEPAFASIDAYADEIFVKYAD